MHYGIATTNLTQQEWTAPAKHILQHLQPGDVVGILPSWALQGAEQLRKAPIMYHPDWTQADLSRYRRVWLLVAPRFGKWWFRKSFRNQINTLRKLYWLKETTQWGKLSLYLFQLPPPRPLLYDFAAHSSVKQAEVWLSTPHPNVPGCSNTSEQVQWLTRWRSHPGWWQGTQSYFLGKLIQEVGNTPRDCLWAEPKRCQILHVRYRLVPLQGTLHVGHGIGTAAPAKVTDTLPPSGPPVQLEVWIENQRVRRYVVTQRQNWRNHQLDLSRLRLSLPPLPATLSPQTRTGSVEFRIQVPGRQQGRLGYCFQATLYRD